MSKRIEALEAASQGCSELKDLISLLSLYRGTIENSFKGGIITPLGILTAIRIHIGGSIVVFLNGIEIGTKTNIDFLVSSEILKNIDNEVSLHGYHKEFILTHISNIKSTKGELLHKDQIQFNKDIANEGESHLISRIIEDSKDNKNISYPGIGIQTRRGLFFSPKVVSSKIKDPIKKEGLVTITVETRNPDKWLIIDTELNQAYDHNFQKPNKDQLKQNLIDMLKVLEEE